MLVPLVVVVIVFVFIGKVIGGEISKIKAPQAIEILDLDNSPTSQAVIEIIKKTNFLLNVSQSGSTEEIVQSAKKKNEKIAMIIPGGFEAGVNSLKPQKIEVYTIMKNFSVMAAVNSEILKAGLAAINDGLSNQLLARSLPEIDPAKIKQPVLENDFVVIGEKQANISPSAVSGLITSQTTFIPIILFMVIIFASQLIASSIASEKENKTLETLLSSPVSRKAVVAAKLIGGWHRGFIDGQRLSFWHALLFVRHNRRIYRRRGNTRCRHSSCVAQLGLTLTTPDYLLLGLSLFFGILAALCHRYYSGFLCRRC